MITQGGLPTESVPARLSDRERLDVLLDEVARLQVEVRRLARDNEALTNAAFAQITAPYRDLAR